MVERPISLVNMSVVAGASVAKSSPQGLRGERQGGDILGKEKIAELLADLQSVFSATLELLRLEKKD